MMWDDDDQNSHESIIVSMMVVYVFNTKLAELTRFAMDFWYNEMRLIYFVTFKDKP